jgi:hypothetical protein
MISTWVLSLITNTKHRDFRELGDEPDEERRELGEESPAWPETWSSGESSATSLTRSDENSARSHQA